MFDDDDDENQLYDLLELLVDDDEVSVWNGTATQLWAALTLLDPTFSITPISLSKTLKTGRIFFVLSTEAKAAAPSPYPIGNHGVWQPVNCTLSSLPPKNV